MEEEKKYSFDEIAGMAANFSMMEIFREVAKRDQSVALTAAVSFFTQVLFLLSDQYRSRLLFILDEISSLMNGVEDPTVYMEKLKAFDLKGRLEGIGA